MSGTVAALKLQTCKGEPFCEAESLTLIAGAGILGDCHFGGKKGQVCLLDESCRRWMEGAEGLCLQRFQENVLVAGISSEEWRQGDVLGIGEAVLEITQKGKKCFPECKRAQEGEPCRLRMGCCFAVVLRGGIVKRGAEVRREPAVAGAKQR